MLNITHLELVTEQTLENWRLHSSHRVLQCPGQYQQLILHKRLAVKIYSPLREVGSISGKSLEGVTRNEVKELKY